MSTHPGAPLPADEKGSNAAPSDTASPRRRALGPGRLWGPAAAEADEVDSNENEAQAQAQACQGHHQQQGLGKGVTSGIRGAPGSLPVCLKVLALGSQCRWKAPLASWGAEPSRGFQVCEERRHSRPLPGWQPGLWDSGLEGASNWEAQVCSALQRLCDLWQGPSPL